MVRVALLYNARHELRLGLIVFGALALISGLITVGILVEGNRNNDEYAFATGFVGLFTTALLGWVAWGAS